MTELRAGATTRGQQAAVEELIAPYVARDLITVPTFDDYIQAGRLLASMHDSHGFVPSDVSLSLTNDALLATSCREEEITLITANVRDFERIGAHLSGFTFRDAAETLGWGTTT